MKKSSPNAITKVRIAVPSNVLKEVKAQLRLSKLDSIVTVLDQRHQPKNLTLYYRCLEEDHGRCHFYIKAQTTLMHKALAASFITSNLEMLIGNMQAAVDGPISWKSIVEFVQR